MSNRLQGKEVKKVLDALVDHLEEREDTIAVLENEIKDLEAQLELKDIEIERQLNDIAELNDYVQDLEASLAEVSLMTSDDGPTLPKAPSH